MDGINLTDIVETVLIEIGDQICDGCGPDRDCGMEYHECFRIQDALDILDDYRKRLL